MAQQAEEKLSPEDSEELLKDPESFFNLPFTEAMERIVLNISSTGMSTKWSTNMVQALYSEILRLRRQNQRLTELDKVSAHDLARRFHETYEKLAPEYGYNIRKETKSWDQYSPNGMLMQAVITEVMGPVLAQAKNNG